MKNSKRESLLAALLVSPTIKAAAKAAGVPETTAYNWLRKPDFADEYKRRKQQAVSEASCFLQSKINDAIQVVAEIMSDKQTSPQTRLAAARAVIELGYKVVEYDQIAARLDALEAVLDDNGR